VAKAGPGLVLLLVIAVVLGTMLLPPLIGYHRYVIDGGSMEPTIARGSIVYERPVPVTELGRGDVITYVPPGYRRPVTHRIVRVERGRNGPPVFQTKGDANSRPDARKVRLEQPAQARYSFHLPYVGFVLIALADPTARMLLLGVPALLAGLMSVRAAWRRGGELVAAEKGSTRPGKEPA
jgi:signal peptidase